DDVVAHLHDRAPPLTLDVVLELDPERSVVPGGARAAVDLPTGEDEPSPLRERDDVINHRCRLLGHGTAAFRRCYAAWLTASAQRMPSRAGAGRRPDDLVGTRVRSTSGRARHGPVELALGVDQFVGGRLVEGAGE